MKPYAITPYPMTPPDDPPEPDLSAAFPCICGREPDWDTDAFGDLFLFCPKRCITASPDSNIDKAIRYWNQEVIEAGDREGEARKAEGQEQVAEHNEAWMDYVTSAIACFAKSGIEFTSEDVRTYCGTWAAFSSPKHPNAWGAAFSRAAKQGLIERVGYQKNRLASAHSRIVSTWRGVSS